MKFPDSQIEIYDFIASTIMNQDVLDKDKDRQIRLALMHLKTTPESTELNEHPEILGISLNPSEQCFNPDNSMSFRSADEYIVSRTKKLNNRYDEILIHLEKNPARELPEFKEQSRLNAELESIVDSLESFNANIVDTAITLTFDDSDYKYVHEVLNLINNKQSLQHVAKSREIGSTYGLKVEILTNKQNASHILDLVNEKIDFDDIIFQNISIEPAPKRLTRLIDNHDVRLQYPKERKPVDLSSLDFSGMNM